MICCNVVESKVLVVCVDVNGMN